MQERSARVSSLEGQQEDEHTMDTLTDITDVEMFHEAYLLSHDGQTGTSVSKWEPPINMHMGGE